MANPTTSERVSVHDLDGDELAAYIAAHTARWGFPPLAGADGADEEADDETGDDDDSEDSDGDQDGDGDEKDAGYWKAEHDKVKRESRKHENRHKRAKADLDRERKRKTGGKEEDGKDADSSAAAAKDIEKAKADARAEAEAEIAAERRSSRLEVAVTRLAAKAFADSEDALIQIERAIRNGDIDEDDIFDDKGRVDADALQEELDELLKRKPHLAASDVGKDDDSDSDAGAKSRRRIRGGSGAGKGDGKSKSLSQMTPADHEKAIRKTN